MTERIAVYRNLNAAKRDWSRFVWSVADVSGTVGRGKLRGHVDAIVLTDVAANCQQGGLRAIRDGGYRSVSAWLIGREIAEAPTGERRAFTINPKRGELAYVWSDDRDTLVDFATVKAVHLTPNGAFAIV